MGQTRRAFPIETEALADQPLSLQQLVEARVDAAVAQRPYFVHMLGVPGAGKTTVARALIDRLTSRPPSFVGFDALMEEMPEYRSAEDREAAFAQFELPARAAGYRLIERLIAKKADILFDHGGSRADHVELLRFARETADYRLAVLHVELDSGVARERVRRRFEAGGRHTPPHYIDERERAIRELLPSYRDVADHYTRFENDAEGFTDELTQLGLLDELARALIGTAGVSGC